MEEHRDSLLKAAQDLDQQIATIMQSNTNNDRLQEKLTLLHKYNAVKDAAQVIIGDVANITGNTISAQHEAFNLPLK